MNAIGRTAYPLCLTLPLLLLAGCGAPDTATLARGNAAFNGVTVAGVTVPVAARAVRIGVNGRSAAACGALSTPTIAALDVRWADSAGGPAKAQLSGELYPCEIAGAWIGIVFPAHGQSLDDCNVTRAVNSPREYQGPCRWGWVESSKLRAAG